MLAEYKGFSYIAIWIYVFRRLACIEYIVPLIYFLDKEPSARRALLQDVPSSEADRNATIVTEETVTESETTETGPVLADVSMAEVAASS